MDTRNSRNQIWVGLVIIAIGVLALVNNLVSPVLMSWAWIITLGASAVICAWQYSRHPEIGTAIVGYVTGSVALVILLTSQLHIAGAIVPVLILALIGLPFLYAGLRNSDKRGLLVPAYVMFAIALLLLFTEMADHRMDELGPTYVMAVIGLPFVVMAFVTQKYALLIPGGILLVIGLFLAGSFVGVGPQVFTIGIPVILIASGALLLLRGGSNGQKTKH